MRYLLDLAREHDKLASEFTPISLGQGMGKIAEEEITKARMNGDWICLQNCHVLTSWMPKLEAIQENAIESEIDPDYRLWLTSMPNK